MGVGGVGQSVDQRVDVGVYGLAVVAVVDRPAQGGLALIGVVVSEVGSGVAQVEGIGEVRLDADGRHAVGHYVVAPLGKDVGVVGGVVDVFLGVVAVGEVVGLAGADVEAVQHVAVLGHRGHLPSGAYLAVVACPSAEFVDEGQHHLAPRVVVAQRVHVGDGQVYASRGAVDAVVHPQNAVGPHAADGGAVAAVVSVGANVVQLLAGEGRRGGGQVGVDVHGGLVGVALPGFHDGVGSHVALQRPVSYLVHLVARGCLRGAVGGKEKECRQFAVRVEDVAVEGEPRQVFVLADGQLVVVGRIGDVGAAAVVVVFRKVLAVAGVVAAVYG